MPHFAVYSGYQMDRETFKMFVSGLPGAEELFFSPKKYRTFVHYALAFNSWKNHLPPKQKRYVPKFRRTLIFPLKSMLNLFIYIFPIARSSFPKEERTFENKPITHIFFPFRFVNYKADSQLTEGHLDNMPITEETPADRAKLDSLIRFLKDRGGVLERDMVTFSYMKELHPSVDWRNVRLPASFIQSSD